MARTAVGVVEDVSPYDVDMALTDDAIERIKAMIVDGEIAPGDRLPPEKELSATRCGRR